MFGFEKNPFSARGQRGEKKEEKKIVVEVADGVAHARTVEAGSDVPEYLQRFSGDKQVSSEDEVAIAGLEPDEQAELNESDGQRKKILSYHRSYFSPEPSKRDNLKTIKKNTPAKDEREKRGEAREFIGKL